MKRNWRSRAVDLPGTTVPIVAYLEGESLEIIKTVVTHFWLQKSSELIVLQIVTPQAYTKIEVMFLVSG